MGISNLYVLDPLRALREMHRLLVPKGRVATFVWDERDRCGWAEVFPNLPFARTAEEG